MVSVLPQRKMANLSFKLQCFHPGSPTWFEFDVQFALTVDTVRGCGFPISETLDMLA